MDEFGSRQTVIPAEVQGRFRTWRNRVYAVLILFFLGLPWVQVNGMQAVLLDIPGRRFIVFGKLFLAHDAPLLGLILGAAALALATVTAVWGRLWCGWACPQTVFIDGVYRRLEIWIEGDYIKRRKLRQSGLTFERLWKSGAKWLAFLAVSLLFAHSFTAYFTGAERIVAMTQGSPSENWTTFVIVMFITGLLLWDFGWFREQFCLIMCPYGRFQSVLMDKHSVTVLYDESRGEPRKAPGQDPAAKRGDCVACNRCVQVCPTGIDIRNGIQMECIACTACIDACDEIMRKVKKPEGLIRYQSLSGRGVLLKRTRVMAYAALIAVCLITLVYNWANQRPYSIAVLRAQDMPFQTLPEDKILNHFKVHLLNQSDRDEEFEIALSDEALKEGVQLTQAKQRMILKPGGAEETHFFLTLPKGAFNATGEKAMQVIVREHISGRQESVKVRAVGPRNL